MLKNLYNKLFKKGNKPTVDKNVIYTECGWVSEVKILEDNSDSEWYRYTLEVLRTLKDGIFNAFPDGYVFTVTADKKCMANVDWRLILPN